VQITAQAVLRYSTVRTKSDEEGDKEGDEYLVLCHLLQNVVVNFFVGTEETVQLDVQQCDEHPAYYLC
jgi:hypothetical protein